MGRPPIFADRVRFVVLLEREELRQIHAAAAAAAVPATTWARRVLVAALSRPAPRRTPR